MDNSERTVLLTKRSSADSSTEFTGLSLLFAIICVVDVFGVLPVLTLSKPIIDCGYGGFLVVIIVCVLQSYTAWLLGKCWIVAEEIEPKIQNKNRYPYSALAELTYGRRFAKLTTLFLNLTIFGGGIPNLIVASQNLQLLGLRLSNNNFDLSYCYWIILMGAILCPFLWLGSPKDMKVLCTVSVALVFFVFILCLDGILMDERITVFPSEDVIQPPLWPSILTAYGILTFQFDIHPTILSIQVDMRRKSDVWKALLGGFLISLLIFSMVYVSAYKKYGIHTHFSILETLPTTTELHFAALFVALQLGLTSAISNTALYQHIEDWMGIPKKFNYRRCVIRTFLTTFSIFIAEIVPKFDLVMSLIGGTLTGPLVFIFPPLLYVKILRLKRTHDQILRMECFNNVVYNEEESSDKPTKYRELEFQDELNSSVTIQEINCGENMEVWFCYCIIVFGSCTTFITTFWNIIGTVDYISFSPPCIFQLANDSAFIF